MEIPQKIEALTEVISKIGRITNKVQMDMPIAYAEYGLLFAILRIEEHQGKRATPSQLSKHLFVTKPAISKMLNSLEDKNYITRKIEKLDRRVVYVELTEAGKTFLKECKEYHISYYQSAFEKLGEEKIDQMLCAAQELYRILLTDFQNKEAYIKMKEGVEK